MDRRNKEQRTPCLNCSLKQCCRAQAPLSSTTTNTTTTNFDVGVGVAHTLHTTLATPLISFRKMTASKPVSESSRSANAQNASTYVSPTPQNTPAQHTLHFSMPTVPKTIEEGEEIEEIGGEQQQSAQVIADAMGSGLMQGALAGLVQQRLSGLIGKSSGYIESLPVEVKRSVAGLQGVQLKQVEIQNAFKREVWELEKKVRSIISSTAVVY